MPRRALSVVLALLLAGIGRLTAATVEGYIWDNVAVGAGAVTGLVLHPREADLAYLRTDVGGCFRFDAHNSNWLPLLDQLSGEENLYGGESIAVDANDPSLVYLAVGKYAFAGPGALLRSDNRGRTWKRGDLSVRMQATGDWRQAGERLAVDPNDGRVLYFGSRFDGLWRSDDAGVHWHAVAGLAARGDAGAGIVFVVGDAAHGSRGQPTSRLFAGAIGAGLWRSDDAGATWTRMRGGPLPGQQPQRAVVAADGALYVSCIGNSEVAGALWRWRDDAWREISPRPGCDWCALAVDANDPRNLACGEFAQRAWCSLYRSADSGDSWLPVADRGGSERNGEVTWWPERFFAAAPAAVAIDPRNGRKLWFGDGYGVWRTADAGAPAPLWKSQMAGLEATTVLALASPRSGAPLLSGLAEHDGMRHDDPRRYPRQVFGGPALRETTGIDVCESRPEIVARIGILPDGRGSGGWSEDGGRTWKAFASWPYAAGGRIAVSADDPRLLVALPVGEAPKRSGDGGATWRDSRGAPAGALDGIWTFAQPLAADRDQGHYFYLYCRGQLLRSDDGGAGWTAIASLPVDRLPQVAVAPGCHGEVWVALDSQGLYRSTDHGEHFDKLPAVGRAQLLAFGRPADVDARPIAFVLGTVDGEDGVFRSDNTGTHWIRISTRPSIVGDGPTCMAGDRQVFGRCYIGSSGRGIFVGQRSADVHSAVRAAQPSP